MLFLYVEGYIIILLYIFFIKISMIYQILPCLTEYLTFRTAYCFSAALLPKQKQQLLNNVCKDGSNTKALFIKLSLHFHSVVSPKYLQQWVAFEVAVVCALCIGCTQDSVF